MYDKMFQACGKKNRTFNNLRQLFSEIFENPNIVQQNVFQLTQKVKHKTKCSKCNRQVMKIRKNVILI